MRSILLLGITLIPFAANAQVASPTDEILTQERTFWTNYTSGNTTALATQLAPDFTNVEQRIWNRTQVLSFVKQFFAKCTMEPVRLVDPHVSFLTPDIATIVYQATESPTCNGATMSGEVNVSTVWVRHDGHWQMHLHTEYALQPSGRM